MSQSTYQQTLDYLFARLPMFSRIGAAALKPSLDNTLRLCDTLGNPQNAFRSLHIAGTNGKGSTSHSLAAIFQQAGYKTGLYTSPHLVDFRERIRVNGVAVEEEWVVDFVEKFKAAIEAVQPSFFEITVAMAFRFFAEQKVDVAVIETGLGGRLDSTNVINPELSIITNIGFDHVDLLGPTLADIAREKAGIIKPGVPVIIGEREDETRTVFEATAAERNSELTWAEDVYSISFGGHESGLANYSATHQEAQESFQFSTDMLGGYQAKNLTTILAAVSVLRSRGWRLEDAAVVAALRKVSALTGLRGRWEILGQQPFVVADVAHNGDGLSAVLEQWSRVEARQKHIVVGFVRDKDVSHALELFPGDAHYYFCNAAIPRALPVDELAKLARGKGLIGTAHSSVEAAVQAALGAMGGGDALLITGSFFVVGEALERFSLG